MAGTVLIHMIGNRDLQFDRTITSDEMELFEFEKNSDQTSFLVLKKLVQKKIDQQKEENVVTFLKQTKKLLGLLATEKHKDLKSKIHFPMFTQVAEYVSAKGFTLDRVVFCVTKQKNEYPTDTTYVADIIEKYFEKDLLEKYGIKEIAYEKMTMNLASRPETFSYCYEKMLPQLVKGYDKVFISHKQGHPFVTFSLLLAGLFEPYTFLVTNAKGAATEEDINFYGNKLKQNFTT